MPLNNDFSPGYNISPLLFKDINLGVGLCLESTVPDFYHTMTKKHADILISLVNNAWFGDSSVAQRHLSMTIFRAVENGRYMIQAANTGISAFITAEGHILSQSALNQTDVLYQEINATQYTTLFNKFHTKFIYFIWIIMLIEFFILEKN